MASLGELELRYTHRKLASPNATPTQYTADSGGTNTLVDAALTEADGYWAGAVVRWDSGPNAGLYSRVRTFSAASDQCTLDEDLPAPVAAGHLYTLFHGGLYSSSVRIPGLAGGTLSNVTGFTVAHVAMMNGTGTGTLRFYASGQSVTWQPPGGSEGPRVSVGALALSASVNVYGALTSTEAASQFVRLTRTAAALPGVDKSDAMILSETTGAFWPKVPGSEQATGSTSYRCVSIRNTGATTTYGLRAYLTAGVPNAAATTLTVGCGLTAATLTAASFANWPASGWIYNATRNDCRYYRNRSGNALDVAAPISRGLTAVSWVSGDVVSLFPWFDIGADAPNGSTQFEDPAPFGTAPSGVAFSAPMTFDAGLSLGDLAASGVTSVWLRFVIPAGADPLASLKLDLRIAAGVDSF